MLTKVLAPLLFVLFLLFFLPTASPPFLISAASNLQDPMNEIVAAFEKKTSIPTEVTYGSSGNLYAQIVQGAPYNLFFSADTEFPELLYEQQHGSAPVTYIRGRLALWRQERISFRGSGLSFLLNDQIKKIAIANPEHAPYGKRAKEILEHYGLWEKIQPKLVLGKNISQTTFFVQSGEAQVGFLSLSMVKSKKMMNVGKYEIIDSKYHKHLDQAYSIIQHNSHSEEFLKFFTSAESQKILLRYGYENLIK